MKPRSRIDAGEVNRQQSQTIPPSSSHISPKCSSYGQWSMAKVQVKHIMHYLGGLLVCLICHWFVCLYICVCVYWVRELLFFLQRDKIVFALAFTHARAGWSPSLFLVCALCWLYTDCACQAVWVCCNDNGPRSGVSAAAEMRIGYF